MSVHWPILRSLLARPLRTVAVDDVKRWRALEMLVAASHIADALEDRCRTQTVGIMLPTGALTPAAMLAGWMLGKTVVPLNYLLRESELRYVVGNCDTDTVVTVQPMLDYVGSRPPVPNVLRLEDIDMKRAPRPRLPSMVGAHNPEALAALLYTSATTGRPKGVMLSHRNLRTNVAQCVEYVRFTRRDILLGVLPQFHSFGLTVLTLLPLMVGCKVVYSARFVPSKIVRLAREHRPTAFIAIPSMYGALTHVKEAAPDDFASVKYLVSGGEGLPAAVAEAFEKKFGARINEGYGLTETSPVTHWCRPFEYCPRSVGMSLPGVRTAIVDPATERDLPPGAEGEIRLSGPNIFAGYYKLPEDTARAFDAQGRFRTGDMGRLDDRGFLSITGRIKEMLIIGGENVFPREIEEVLDMHAAVDCSGVVGKPDPMRGEAPIAFVQLVEGKSATEAELRQWCRERIANYKAPKEVRIVEQIPRGPTGKVLRRDLAERVRSEVEAEQRAASV